MMRRSIVTASATSAVGGGSAVATVLAVATARPRSSPRRDRDEGRRAEDAVAGNGGVVAMASVSTEVVQVVPAAPWGAPPFFRRRKTCRFSGAGAPKNDYKDARLLQRYVPNAARSCRAASPRCRPRQRRGLAQAIERARFWPVALRDRLTVQHPRSPAWADGVMIIARPGRFRSPNGRRTGDPSDRSKARDSSMTQFVLIGIGAGAATAALFASVASGCADLRAAVLSRPAADPDRALGWSHPVALIAAVVASAGLAACSSPVRSVPVRIGCRRGG